MIKNKTFYYYLSAIGLTLAIFLFVHTKKKDSKMPNANQENSSYSLVDYKTDFFKRQSDSIQKQITKLESQLAQSNDSLSKVRVYSEMLDFYTRIGSPENSALTVFEKAKLIKNTNSWKICGDNFIQLIMDRKVDSALVKDLSKYAISSFENSITLDSNNTESKIKLAECYMELGGAPMQGVQLLIGITKKDPNNIDALFLLAKFGLISGQYDKVLTRVNKILSLQPENIQARLMRVDANVQLGLKKEAIQDLQFLKTTKGVPEEMKKQLDAAIADIEKK